MYIRSGSKFACKQKVCHEKKEPFEETDSDLEASLDVSSRYLDDKWEANASTNLIKRQIEQINKRLSQVEKETLIIEADTSKVFENHIKIYFCFWYLNFYSQIPMHVFIQTFERLCMDTRRKNMIWKMVIFKHCVQAMIAQMKSWTSKKSHLLIKSDATILQKKIAVRMWHTS